MISFICAWETWCRRTSILEGDILIDQSALTGESLPVEVAPDEAAYAGSLVKRGEASGVVTATGQRTRFGKTAELVRAAKTASHLESIIFTIVKYLVASVPVALPATFTLATGLGALELARHGVLAARLSAIEEAAAMDLLCSDKTGTITQNRLALAALRPYASYTEQDLCNRR